MRWIIFSLLLINLIKGEDFISEFEYGQMLFSNPRGVSCSKCHGNLGKGKFIAEFTDSKGEVHKFFGPDITKIPFKLFDEAINKGGKIMPRYYLTKKEIRAIFKYIQLINETQNEAEDGEIMEDRGSLNSKTALDKSKNGENNESNSTQNSHKNEINSKKNSIISIFNSLK